MKPCPNCGEDVSTSSDRFCPNCGSMLPWATPAPGAGVASGAPTFTPSTPAAQAAPRQAPPPPYADSAARGYDAPAYPNGSVSASNLPSWAQQAPAPVAPVRGADPGMNALSDLVQSAVALNFSSILKLGALLIIALIALAILTSIIKSLIPLIFVLAIIFLMVRRHNRRGGWRR